MNAIDCRMLISRTGSPRTAEALPQRLRDGVARRGGRTRTALIGESLLLLGGEAARQEMLS